MMKNLHLITSSSNLETYRMVQTIPENSIESSYQQNIENAATLNYNVKFQLLIKNYHLKHPLILYTYLIIIMTPTKDITNIIN